MKYYTETNPFETIPFTLAEKLKEKGMPIEVQPLYAQEALNASGIVKAGVGLWCPSYAEVFDWLMEKGIRITLRTYPAREPFAWGYRLWAMDGGILYDPNPAPKIMKLDCHPTWYEAVNAAIEKALTLI